MTTAQPTSRSRDREQRSALALAGSLAVACNLAVAQPVLDLLARNPEFFAARRAPAVDVVLVALAMALLLPAALVAVVAAVRRVSPAAGALLHAVLLAVLGAAIAVQLLDALVPWPLLAPLAAALGVGLAVAYRRIPSVRTVLGAGLVVPLLVLGLFVVGSPFLGGGTATATVLDDEVRVGNPVPVVVVVLDELPVTTLLDAAGRIDAGRFPGFARLAGTSTWFPNAATPYDHTHRILPAALTGQPWRRGRAPVAADYPRNLFTVLADSHDVVARERVTWLCPPDVCETTPDPAGQRLRDLATDVGVVASHVVLPEPLTRSLPPLDAGWGGFGDRAVETAAPPGAADMSFEEFLRSFRDGDGAPLLRYYHLMAPHHPFHTLPDGSSYPQALPMPAYDEGPPDRRDAFYIAQAHQRHLLQTGALDRRIDRLLDTLEAWPAYDDALVVVFADHGISFRAGQSLRLTRAGNVDEIAYVPLFVKAPGQRRGAVDERPALVTDLMATVVDVLDIDGLDGVGGVSLLGPAPDPQRPRALRSLLGSVHRLPPDGADRARALRQQTARFGPGGDWDAVWRHGPHDDLVGTSLDDLDVGAAEPAEITLHDLPAAPPEGAPRPEGPSRPTLVDGRVSGPTVDAGTWLAVVVGDRVAATTLVHDREAGPDRFTAMVPPEAYREGATTPRLARIEETDDGVRLHPLTPTGDGGSR